MPSPTFKKSLKEIILALGAIGITFPDLEALEEDETLILLTLLEIHRYADARNVVPKSTHWIDNVLIHEDFGNRFRSQLRMDKDAFIDLVDLLKGSRHFRETQEAVPLQIAVFLFRLGNFGNAAGITHIATKFGIGEGTVEKFTDRVINAITDISNQHINWPNPEERRAIGTHMAEHFLPKCVGFVDGSDAVFYAAPQFEKETYWSRKKRYCMQFQIVCDPAKAIRNLITGFPGSCHDAKVYSASKPFVNSRTFFSEGEFLIGDAAYPKSETVVVPFRKVQGQLEESKKRFNKHISGQRVVVEHTIGLLKGRFQSLQGLRIHVDQERGHKLVCKWIQAACVLHNILNKRDPWVREGDTMYEENDSDDSLDYGNNPLSVSQRYITHRAELKRKSLMTIISTMTN